MFYFSFGSNMSSKRLFQRINAIRIGVAVLSNHKLCFHKYGESDNSGKCDILLTDNKKDFVIGVVYKIDESHKKTLDKIEGLGCGYDIKIVPVVLNGTNQDVFTYFATDIDPSVKPYHWYKQHVLEGARENDFPEDYIASIENVQSVKDKNRERAARELAIYSI